ncbi:MAG: MMPL family transporter, partial [Candidatus Omnitrophica bacterium]|nr:MMPL family transporter [Candidatus Omnitrophota bacterium]
MPVPRFILKITTFFQRLSPEVWTFLTLSILSFTCLTLFVDLNPVVDDNFFFSSEDPQFQSEHQIDELFIRKDTQLIIAATGDINSPVYRGKVSRLSQTLLDITGVTSVNSLTHFGPKNVTDALESPLWKRLIISDDQRSSNIIILLDERNQSQIVANVERILSNFQSKDFHLRAAGLPYVIEQIRRNLTRDLKMFSILAFLIFGLLIFGLFRSKSILIGTLLACLNACVWTYMLTSLTHIPIGLLTATLGTIIFVMTLSHIIFMTFNWRTAMAQRHARPVDHALRQTLAPSFWSMLTTVLGFLSLTSVPAKPLRDLGTAGIIGSLVALGVAYGFFPAFLRLTRRVPAGKTWIEKMQGRLYVTLYRQRKNVGIVIFVAALLALPGLRMIDSDPSLLSYFASSSEIHQGFTYIDRNGGSSPLILVVRSRDGEALNTKASYRKLWNLQDALELHRSVGSSISLPVLIAEAKKTPVGWILTREFLLSMMESEEYDQIAKSFVTEDRQHGLYLLRMHEQFRNLPRVKIVDEIKAIADIHGFEPELVGGVYNLQGHLARLVASSLVFGLGKLMIFFFLIAWWVSRSLSTAMAVTISILMIPLIVFGLIGIYRIPLDIVAAPACNVAIAMG